MVTQRRGRRHRGGVDTKAVRVHEPRTPCYDIPIMVRIWRLWNVWPFKGRRLFGPLKEIAINGRVVICMFGSDSQVTLDWYLRMYLYWIAVFAGRFTVTERGRGGQRPARWGRTKGAG